jgi:hypothetical protein
VVDCWRSLLAIAWRKQDTFDEESKWSSQSVDIHPKNPRKLSITSKHVIITCLHKGNKPRYFFYTVYTIGSEDLRKVLDRLIDLDLTGSLLTHFIIESPKLKKKRLIKFP